MNARHRGVSTETVADLDAEGPLRRWARRKREVAREKNEADEARRRDEPRDAPEAAGESRESTDDGPAPAVVEEKVLTDEDMPPLGSLDENSDYSGFLSPGVSEALRRRALRKLFSSAAFNIPDGLDDYDDDFTSFAALGDIVTSDMKHQAEMEAKRAEQAQARSEPAADIEEESRVAGGEQPAPAGDDATVQAEADSTDETDPAEPAALAGSFPPDAVTDEDPAGNGERRASPASGDRRSRETVAEAGSPADAQAPDEAGATGCGSGEAASGSGSAASAGGSENESQASAGGEVPATAGKAEYPVP